MEETIGERKKTLRREVLAARSAVGAQHRAEAAARICAGLTALPRLERAKIILSYSPMEEETDVSAFHAWAADYGVAVAYPVTGKNGQMEAYIPRDASAMRADRYGILSPVPEESEHIAPERLDAVIVPCVAFTAAGARLGHGGGYYDRYLPRCPQAVRVLPAFEAQRVPALPTDGYDLPVHIIVTEISVTELTEG